jgi:uncharacterized protein YdeI (YjbR/CyaY-like superfamily)
MGIHDPRVDAYIGKAGDFAKPILTHIRELMHEVCPDVEETMKWSFAVFMYKGDMLCTLASFKNYCAFGFWKRPLLTDDNGIFKDGDGAGSIGPVKTLADLPKDTVLKKYIRAAMKLNDEGIKVPRPKPVAKDKKQLQVPDYFIQALKQDKAAEKIFNDFSYSNKKEYIEWFEEAKTQVTRDKRIAQAMEWITTGKSHNWKYAGS